MTTADDVANMAIALLNEAPISSLEDDVAAARLINVHYDVAREAELLKHAWAFATMTQTIVGVDTGVGTLRYAYDLPADCLRPLPLTENGEASGVPISWELRNGALYTDKAGPLTLRYIANITDPDDWDATFTDVLAAALAVRIAHALTHKLDMVQVARDAYQTAYLEAQRVNGLSRGSVMPAEVDIANLALGLIDEAPIDNLDQDNKAARLVNLHYVPTRQAEIAKHAWTFAIKTASLTGTDSGEDGLSWSYDLPADCLRVLPLTYDGEPDGIPIAWVQREHTILTDQASPRIVQYIADVPDPTEWDAAFKDLMIAALALKIVLPITKNAGMVQLARQAYEVAALKAMRVNAYQRGSMLYTAGWPTQRGDNRYWRA